MDKGPKNLEGGGLTSVESRFCQGKCDFIDLSANHIGFFRRAAAGQRQD